MQQQRRAAITGERERMAHELHDTLAQPFAGSRFNCIGIRNRLRLRERAPFDMVDQQLDATSDFVRRTHQEASFSIDMLRSQSPEVGDLATALERSAGELTPPGVATVRIVGESTGYAMRCVQPTPSFTSGGKLLSMPHAMQGRRKSTSPSLSNASTSHWKSRTMDLGFLRDPVCQRFGSRAWSAVPQLSTRLFSSKQNWVRHKDTSRAPVPHRGRLFGYRPQGKLAPELEQP